MKGAWVAAGVPAEVRSGGSIRARAIFAELIRRTGAGVAPRTELLAIARARISRPLAPAGPLRLASAQLVSPRLFRLEPFIVPEVLDLHDHPVLHADALGLAPPPDVRRRLLEQTAQHVAGFRTVVVQSTTFADLCEVPPERRLLVPNGTDTRHVRPGPLPEGPPSVGFASGAAPGRGIELLVEAVRRLRGGGGATSETRLDLALTPTGAESAAYMAGLQAGLASEAWLRIRDVPYPDLPDFLAGCHVLVVPHPPSAYFDAILPVKLFDSMAAGRPLAVTPRSETARIVREADAGLVADDDTPDALADAIARLFDNRELAARTGASGRRAAESAYDWALLAARVADVILGPAADDRPGRTAR